MSAQSVYDELVAGGLDDGVGDASYAMRTAVVAYIYFVSEPDPTAPNVEEAFRIPDEHRSAWPVERGESRSFSGHVWKWTQIGDPKDPSTSAFSAFHELCENGFILASSPSYGCYSYWVSFSDRGERKAARDELDRRLIVRREPFLLALSALSAILVQGVRSIIVDYASIPIWELVLPEMPHASLCPRPAVIPQEAVGWFPKDLFSDADHRGIRKTLQDKQCRYCKVGILNFAQNEWTCQNPRCPLKIAIL